MYEHWLPLLLHFFWIAFGEKVKNCSYLFKNTWTWAGWPTGIIRNSEKFYFGHTVLKLLQKNFWYLLINSELRNTFLLAKKIFKSQQCIFRRKNNNGSVDVTLKASSFVSMNRDLMNKFYSLSNLFFAFIANKVIKYFGCYNT